MANPTEVWLVSRAQVPWASGGVVDVHRGDSGGGGGGHGGNTAARSAFEGDRVKAGPDRATTNGADRWQNVAVIEGELGTFLRSRREAVTPAEVGLPDGPRRRTPGLRRAELATLAGVSVDYLIRIEQGRDTHPSPQVLAALAEALRLSEDDLNHLRQLAVISNGVELCPHARAAARAVRPTVRAVLERLEPAPAFVVNHLGRSPGVDRRVRAVGAPARHPRR